ncbi:MAG: hypothetical protein ACLT33_08000 [Lachnospira pectinoschiza]
MLTGAVIITAPERVVTDGNITTSRGMGITRFRTRAYKTLRRRTCRAIKDFNTIYIISLFYARELLKMKYDNYDEDAMHRSRKRKSQLMKKKRQKILRRRLIMMQL